MALEPRAVVIDVETTGLSPRLGHRVCEVGLVVVQGGRIVDSFETLVNPGTSIPWEATCIHRITDNDVVGAPSFNRILPRLLSYLNGAVLVAHKASFDHSFLENEIRMAYGEKHGLPLPSICTMRMAWRRFGRGYGSLEHLCSRLGVHNSFPHHALPDARAEAEVFLRLLRPPAFTARTLGRLNEEGLVTIYGSGELPRPGRRSARATPRPHY